MITYIDYADGVKSILLINEIKLRPKSFQKWISAQNIGLRRLTKASVTLVDRKLFLGFSQESH